MQELAQRAVREALAAGADYADARVVRTATEDLGHVDGAVTEAEAPCEFGLGVRALVRGALAYAAVPGTHHELVDLAAGVARRAARAARDLSGARRCAVTLAPEAPRLLDVSTPCGEDPFLVPLEEKLGWLAAVVDALEDGRGELRREAWLSFQRRERWLATSEGGEVHGVTVRSGGGARVSAFAQGALETRTSGGAPCGHHRAGGFEVIAALGLVGEAGRLTEELRAVCAAPPCPAGRRDVVLMPGPLAVLLDAAVTLASCASRVTGGGLLAGAPRWLALWSDPAAPGALHAAPVDDEGTSATAMPLVVDGRWVGLPLSRTDVVPEHVRRAPGALVGAGFAAPPRRGAGTLVLRGGAGRLAELFAGAREGALMVDTVREVAVDPLRRVVRVACEVAREVRGGPDPGPGRHLRRPTLEVAADELGRAWEALAGDEETVLATVPVGGGLHGAARGGRDGNLGLATHAVAPARFRGLSLL